MYVCVHGVHVSCATATGSFRQVTEALYNTRLWQYSRGNKEPKRERLGLLTGLRLARCHFVVRDRVRVHIVLGIASLSTPTEVLRLGSTPRRTRAFVVSPCPRYLEYGFPQMDISYYN